MESKSSLNFIIKALLFAGLIAFASFTKAEKSTTRPLLMPNVQPKVPETYLCTSFTMPKHDFQYVVGFTPNASMHTAHHILIFGCEIPGQWERDTPRLVWDCGEMSGHQSGYLSGPTCSAGSQIIYAWAKDAPPLKLPEGVGFKVGKGTKINYLVMQVHYAHVDQFLNGETDNSGIILTLLPSNSLEVTKTAGVYLLGTNGMIRAREEEHFEVACRMNEPVVIHPFAFRTHTHALGRVVSAYKIDKNGKWHLIGKHDPQEPQMFYPVEDKDLIVEYGDVLAARCTMYNFRKKTTYVGPTGEDEMCNFYMMYYVDGDKPLKDNYCFSIGPNRYYWDRDLLVGYVPQEVDEGASNLENSI